MRLCTINEDVLKVLIFGAKNWSKILKSDVSSSSNISTTITGVENLGTYLESWINLEDIIWGQVFNISTPSSLKMKLKLAKIPKNAILAEMGMKDEASGRC